LRDGWHAVDYVVKHSQRPDMRGQLGRVYGRILRTPLESDVELAMGYLARRRRRPIHDKAAAKAEALDKYKWCIRTFGREPEAITKELEDATKVFVDEKEAWDKQKKTKRMGPPPAFRGKTSGGGISTQQAAESVIRCARKGCLSSPFATAEENHYKIGKPGPLTGLQEYGKKGESSANESMHKQMNQLYEHISRLNSEESDARLHMRIFRANHDNDVRLGWVPDHPPLQSLQWKLLKENCTGILDGAEQMFSSVNIPVAPPMVYDEATGTERPTEVFGFEYLSLSNQSKLPQLPLNIAESSRLVSSSTSLIARPSTSATSKPPAQPPNRVVKMKKPKAVGAAKPRAPESEAEKTYATKCLAGAMSDDNNKTDLHIYEAAAEIWNLKHLESYHSNPENAFPRCRTTTRILREWDKITSSKGARIQRNEAFLGQLAENSTLRDIVSSERPLASSSSSSSSLLSSSESSGKRKEITKVREVTFCGVKKQRRKDMNEGYRASADTVVGDGKKLKKSDVDGLSYYQAGAYLQHMKEHTNDKQVRVGNNNKERKQNLMNFFDRNKIDEYDPKNAKLQKRE